MYHRITVTLLKIKVPKGSFRSDAKEKKIRFHKELFGEQFLKEQFFLSVKNIVII